MLCIFTALNIHNIRNYTKKIDLFQQINFGKTINGIILGIKNDELVGIFLK